jgi:hypothetical protein
LKIRHIEECGENPKPRAYIILKFWQRRRAKRRQIQRRKNNKLVNKEMGNGYTNKWVNKKWEISKQNSPLIKN